MVRSVTEGEAHERWQLDRRPLAAQFKILDVLEVPPISQHGNLKEIAAKFGGTDKLMETFNKLQEMLYAA
jgi:hypothetical protein